MSCALREGRWEQARLIFDTVADAMLDDHILELDPPGGSTTVRGRFLHPTTGVDLGDTLTEGTCNAEGIRPRITFTRRHNGGRVTTVYTGKLIFISSPSRLLVRGRFTRTTVSSDNMTQTTLTGDWETEKPT
jgi:hypothetical protein